MKDDRDHEKLAWRKEAQNWDYLLCSSEEVREIYSNAFGVSEDIIYPIGIPRNDCFYDKEKILELKKYINSQIGNKFMQKNSIICSNF